jgi:hypothetical protein
MRILQFYRDTNVKLSQKKYDGNEHRQASDIACLLNKLVGMGIFDDHILRPVAGKLGIDIYKLSDAFWEIVEKVEKEQF